MEPLIVSGNVIQGLQQGRTLGYPTINIAYEGALAARPGVYAARVQVSEGIDFNGAAIVGGDFLVTESPKLEIHLLGDTKEQRYGEFVTIELLDFVSELVRIHDLAELKNKIENDIVMIRKMF